MHRKNEYRFTDEQEAIKFALTERESRTPDEDKKVIGPMFMDEAEIFKNMSWVGKTDKYWLVTVESHY